MWRWDQQESFGANVADENPSDLGPFKYPGRFPGQYFDEETGLYYNYFRDYNAGIARYIESDPIGLAGGVNPLAYAYGPLTQTDVRGLTGRRGGSNIPPGPKEPSYFVFFQAILIVVPIFPFPGVMGETTCGSYGVVPNVLDTTSIEGACSAHDKCYATCGLWKDDCDNKLSADIRQACGSGVRCVVGAQLYHQVVQRAGETAFLDAREHCRHGECKETGAR